MPLERQLAAACTVYPYEASRILDVRVPGNPNAVPDREWFAPHFTFTPEQLREYITEDPLRAGQLITRSLDQRTMPSAYVVDDENGLYEVGWFDGDKHDIVRYEHVEDAATDFVLAYWGLPRLRKPDRPMTLWDRLRRLLRSRH